MNYNVNPWQVLHASDSEQPPSAPALTLGESVLVAMGAILSTGLFLIAVFVMIQMIPLASLPEGIRLFAPMLVVCLLISPLIVFFLTFKAVVSSVQSEKAAQQLGQSVQERESVAD